MSCHVNTANACWFFFSKSVSFAPKNVQFEIHKYSECCNKNPHVYITETHHQRWTTQPHKLCLEWCCVEKKNWIWRQRRARSMKLNCNKGRMKKNSLCIFKFDTFYFSAVLAAARHFNIHSMNIVRLDLWKKDNRTETGSPFFTHSTYYSFFDFNILYNNNNLYYRSVQF